MAEIIRIVLSHPIAQGVLAAATLIALCSEAFGLVSRQPAYALTHRLFLMLRWLILRGLLRRPARPRDPLLEEIEFLRSDLAFKEKFIGEQERQIEELERQFVLLKKEHLTSVIRATVAEYRKPERPEPDPILADLLGRLDTAVVMVRDGATQAEEAVRDFRTKLWGEPPAKERTGPQPKVEPSPVEGVPESVPEDAAPPQKVEDAPPKVEDPR